MTLLSFIPDFPSMHWYKFQRLGTIYAYMHRLQLQFPHLIEVLTIGKTDQGRDILLAKVGRSNSVYPKKAIFIEAGQNKTLAMLYDEIVK